MNTAAEPIVPKWTWMRWLVVVAIVLAFHVLLIFIFGARKPITPAVVKDVPSLTLADAPAQDWLNLNDATLFALPSANGFAGMMWVELPPLPFRRQDWTEPPRWLALPAGELGADFHHFVQTNQFVQIQLELNLPPPLAAPVVAMQPPLPAASTVQVQGLASRGLLTAMKLPSWPFEDVIAPSVVQVLVDANGNVVSAVLLPPENALEPNVIRDPDADDYAVAQARTARFAPAPSNAGSMGTSRVGALAFGRLIFNWQTVPKTKNATQ